METKDQARDRLYSEWRSMDDAARQKWLNTDCDYLGMKQKMTPEEYYFFKRWMLDA